jgi:hypothetical protein
LLKQILSENAASRARIVSGQSRPLRGPAIAGHLLIQDFRQQGGDGLAILSGSFIRAHGPAGVPGSECRFIHIVLLEENLDTTRGR